MRRAPITAVIGFRCGRGRSWLNLWKPTIDALGPLIGEGARMWSPRDGAIVDLALHQEIDPALRWDVDVFVQVGPANLYQLLRSPAWRHRSDHAVISWITGDRFEVTAA